MDWEQSMERARSMVHKLYGKAYVCLKNGADSQDAVQETLIKVWRYGHTLRDEAAFDYWVARVMYNECMQILRREKRHRHDALPEEIAELPDRIQSLYDALLALEDKYRSPIVLHHLEGFTVREVAEMLGEPIETIKSRLCRGCELLKAQIEGEEER